MPYDMLTKKVSGSCAEVPSGVECLRNSSHPLLKVTICSSSSDHFALLVSLSHIIADGYTYYRIFHMLTRKLTPVLSLRPERKLAFHQERLRALGRPEYEFIFSPAYVLNSLTSKYLWGRPQCRAYVINMEKVKQLQVQAAKTVPAVPLSTNDIVTSSVARLFGARACSMAVNFRGRLANLSEDDAGNYQGLLWFGPDDISGPSLVRAALEQGRQHGVYRRCGDPDGQLPGFWEMLCSRLAVITSWVFKDEPMLEGCTMGLHLPHFDLDEVNSDMAVIFRPRPGQQAVMLFTKDLNVDVLATAPDSVLGEPALLMLERGISFEEAWTFCEKRRPIVYPNVGFQQQLRHLEKVMTEKVDFKATWQKQVKQLREALPKGDLEGPKSPLPIRDAIGSCMGAALNELEALVDKVLSQPQLLQKRELWKRQGLFFENLHKYKAIPGDLGLLSRAKVAADQLRSLQKVYSDSLKGVKLANAVAQELEDWSKVAAPELEKAEAEGQSEAKEEKLPQELSKKDKKRLKKEKKRAKKAKKAEKKAAKTLAKIEEAAKEAEHIAKLAGEEEAEAARRIAEVEEELAAAEAAAAAAEESSSEDPEMVAKAARLREQLNEAYEHSANV
ncbi:unnamed protein product [Symbiodinium sp. CCMP2456]|nr:unnamed protein product [Symbiodinium sp. CCMP2456]